MRVFGLVPARGGSKGIPGKNLRSLGGKPLLAWTAEAAHAARHLQRVVLSTEDARIATIGRQVGLDVPFLRPAALARDDTPMLPVVQQAFTTLDAAGERFDAVCLLQPTSPFRSAALIDAAIERLARGDVDTVISVLPVPHEHNPHWVFFAHGEQLVLATGEEEPIARRQALPPAFHRDGSVYVVRREQVLGEDGRRPSLFGPRIAGVTNDRADRADRADGRDADNAGHHVNLDTPQDWARAERLVAGEEP